MALARHTKANREFFEPGEGPELQTWLQWVRSGCVKGKIIDGKPWIDLVHFAANDELNPPPEPSCSGLELLD
jgi:hypothetical protein